MNYIETNSTKSTADKQGHYLVQWFSDLGQDLLRPP